MKDLLAVIMKRFLNPTLIDGKLAKDLVAINASDPENQLLLKRMDFGQEAMSQVTVDKIQICVCRWFVGHKLNLIRVCVAHFLVLHKKFTILLIFSCISGSFDKHQAVKMKKKLLWNDMEYYCRLYLFNLFDGVIIAIIYSSVCISHMITNCYQFCLDTWKISLND